jgi:hypothetical protein
VYSLKFGEQAATEVALVLVTDVIITQAQAAAIITLKWLQLIKVVHTLYVQAAYTDVYQENVQVVQVVQVM